MSKVSLKLVIHISVFSRIYNCIQYMFLFKFVYVRILDKIFIEIYFEYLKNDYYINKRIFFDHSASLKKLLEFISDGAIFFTAIVSVQILSFIIRMSCVPCSKL